MKKCSLNKRRSVINLKIWPDPKTDWWHKYKIKIKWRMLKCLKTSWFFPIAFIIGDQNLAEGLAKVYSWSVIYLSYDSCNAVPTRTLGRHPCQSSNQNIISSASK